MAPACAGEGVGVTIHRFRRRGPRGRYRRGRRPQDDALTFLGAGAGTRAELRSRRHGPDPRRRYAGRRGHLHAVSRTSARSGASQARSPACATLLRGHGLHLRGRGRRRGAERPRPWTSGGSARRRPLSVLFVRAVVEHPAGYDPSLPLPLFEEIHGEAVIAFRKFSPLGIRLDFQPQGIPNCQEGSVSLKLEAF